MALNGSGVEFDSDDLSMDSGGWTEGEGSGLIDEDDLGFAAGTSAGNRSSRSGERFKTTILLFFDDLDDDLVVVLVDDMVDDGGVDGWFGY